MSTAVVAHNAQGLRSLTDSSKQARDAEASRTDYPMRNLTATLKLSMAIVFATVTLAALCAPAAQARTYPDVPNSYWDYSAINWVTNQGPIGAKLLNDYSGKSFGPALPLSREQLAAALVTALGHQNDSVANPVALTDLPTTDPYFHAVQVALALHFFAAANSKFDPEAGVTESQADHALVRMIYLLHPHNDWSMLRALEPTARRQSRPCGQ
jgi:hypothetical protein